MKTYNQPNTQVTKMALLTVVCQSVNMGITEDPTTSSEGMAPNRGFSGDQQGLKYLI